jgi:hypothetical protein
VKYMLLFCGTREAQRAFETMTPEELGLRLAEVGGWFAENESRIIESNQLAPPESGTTVIDVPDLDDALAMASTWPGGASVEVRPVVGR